MNMNTTMASNDSIEDGLLLKWVHRACIAVWVTTPVFGLVLNTIVILLMIYCLCTCWFGRGGRKLSVARYSKSTKANINTLILREMLTPTNVYILNLAIADCIFLVGAPLQVQQSFRLEWTLGSNFCQAYLGMLGVAQFVSPLLIGLLSFDRFICVCRSISCATRLRTLKIATMASMGAWLMVIITAYPIFQFSGVKEVDTKDGMQKKCMIFVSENQGEKLDYLRRTVFYYTFMFGFLVPMASVWTFYAAIIWKLWNRAIKSNERTRRVTLTGMSIVLCYTACWTPYWVVQWCIELYLCDYETARTLSYAANALQYINCSINPCLYIFFSTPFKKSVRIFRERLDAWCKGVSSLEWDQEQMSDGKRSPAGRDNAHLRTPMLPIAEDVVGEDL